MLTAPTSACTSSESTKVDANGGVVRSKDRTVSVTFGRGQVDDGTAVRIDTVVDAPPPPPLVEPLDRPFDVVIERGAARAGHVSVTLGKFPTHLLGETILMFVENGRGGWAALSTVVDPATGVISADWPHFSKGFLAKAQGFGQSSWNKVVRFGRDAKDAVTDVAEVVADGVVALVGGTTDTVQCKPDSDSRWRFEGRNGDGGHLAFPSLTGCSMPFDTERASWQVRIGNRYPVPYLLSLPAGVSAPGFWDLPESMDIGDLLATMVLSRWDRVVVPGGSETSVRVSPAAGDDLTFGGYTDPWTLALRAAALVAAIATWGESATGVAVAKAQIRSEYELLDQARAQARKSGNARLLNSDIAIATKWDSDIARSERIAALKGGAVAVDDLFDIVDLLNCAVGFFRDAGGNGTLREKVDQAFNEIVSRCFPVWAERVATRGVERLADAMTPNTKLEQVKRLAAGIITQILEIRRLAFATNISLLKEFTASRFDYIHTQLTSRRSTPADPAELRRLGLCTGKCNVTSAVDFTHPSWGLSTLVTTTSDGDYLSWDAYLAVFDADGNLKWKHHAGDWPQLAAATPAMDKTGNLFLTFNPGRYDGVIVLAPAANGFNTYDTLPPEGSFFSSRFYVAQLKDLDSDGKYEIEQGHNTCQPECASGNYVFSVHEWNGTDYVKR